MVGLWGASYLVGVREVTADTAALWVSLYYGGITVGRFITGFISLKVSNRLLIRFGQIIAVIGGIVLLFPNPTFILAGLILIGLGLAPIYPSMLHETPARFGRENSARLMGYQMAVAYTGTTFLPPLFGVLAMLTDIRIFPVVLLVFIILMLLSLNFEKFLEPPQKKVIGSSWLPIKAFTLLISQMWFSCVAVSVRAPVSGSP